MFEQAQYTNESTGVFVMRTRFEANATDVEVVRARLESATVHFSPTITLRAENDLPRILVMVSQYDHCLVDLLYRQSHGEIAMDVPVIVSNHEACRVIAEQYDIPFTYVPVESGVDGSKAAAESRLREIIEEYRIDAVVLARYMQILSPTFVARHPHRIINIHHSFLPAFVGANPYQQAHDRGVKLIGATSHYVTEDLDQGPIIEQNVQRVSHRHSAAELRGLGQDVERQVMLRAVRWHLEDRVIVDGNKTVVFVK